MEVKEYQALRVDALRLERLIVSLVSRAARLYTKAGDFATDAEINDYWQLMDDATKYGGEYNALIMRMGDFKLHAGGWYGFAYKMP